MGSNCRHGGKKQIKTGATDIRHGRHVAFWMAEFDGLCVNRWRSSSLKLRLEAQIGTLVWRAGIHPGNADLDGCEDKGTGGIGVTVECRTRTISGR